MFSAFAEQLCCSKEGTTAHLDTRQGWVGCVNGARTDGDGTMRGGPFFVVVVALLSSDWRNRTGLWGATRGPAFARAAETATESPPDASYYEILGVGVDAPTDEIKKVRQMRRCPAPGVCIGMHILLSTTTLWL